MMYYFTGIQHKHDGSEVAFPTFAYTNKDEYLAKYHQEMNYALGATNVLDGLTVLVYDSTGVIVLNDHWMRTVNGSEMSISPVEGES